MAIEIRKCRVCQEDFFAQITPSSAKTVKYCSNRCKAKARSAELRKKKKFPIEDIYYKEEME